MISTYFYFTWILIGVLVILAIITLLILALVASRKFYKLTKLVYKEQQEILSKINEAINTPEDKKEEEILSEVEEEDDKTEDVTETE